MSTLSVTTIFDYDEKLGGSDDVVIAGDEIITFQGGDKKTKRHVVRGPTRKSANLAAPDSWLQGIWTDTDGTWHAGAIDGRVVVSTTLGKTWDEESDASSAIGKARIWSVVRFDGGLWAASESGVARWAGKAWVRVPFPEGLQPAKAYDAHDRKYLPRLVVLGDTLYLLGKGLARWDGEAFTMELDCGHDLRALAETPRGTLLAAGAPKVEGTGATAKALRGVWRKVRGGAWEHLSEAAVSVSEKAPGETMNLVDTFAALACEGDLVVLVGRFGLPGKQLDLIRVSEDDGQTFRPLPVKAKGYLVGRAAVADGRGGVLVSVEGGVLLRVSHDGLGTWADVPEKASKKKKT